VLGTRSECDLIQEPIEKLQTYNCMTVRTMMLREFTELKVKQGKRSREAHAA